MCFLSQDYNPCIRERKVEVNAMDGQPADCLVCPQDLWNHYSVFLSHSLRMNDMTMQKRQNEEGEVICMASLLYCHFIYF